MTLVRAIRPDEWESFRELRLHALRTEPGVFLSPYATESAYAPEEWQKLLAIDDGQVFGLYDDDRLVGVTAAFTWRHDPSRKTAVFAMTYILPEYRGRGLSRLYFDARIAWVRAHPQFEKMVVSHRVGNEPSRSAILRAGFTYWKTESKTWPDGTVADEDLYTLSK